MGDEKNQSDDNKIKSEINDEELLSKKTENKNRTDSISTDEETRKEKDYTPSSIKEEAPIPDTRHTRSKVAISETGSDTKQIENVDQTTARRKTRSNSNASVDSLDERSGTPTRLTRSKNKLELNDTDVTGLVRRSRRRRSNSSESKDSSISPARSSPDESNKLGNKAKEETNEKDEDEDGEIIIKMPRTLRNRIILANQTEISSSKPLANDIEQKTEENKDKDIKEENDGNKPSKANETTVSEKRKRSEDDLDPRSSKKIAISHKSESSTPVPVKYEEKKKKKLLGPRSQRKNPIPSDDSADEDDIETTPSTQSNKKRKLLGPRSKRKKEDILSDDDEDAEDEKPIENEDKKKDAQDEKRSEEVANDEEKDSENSNKGSENSSSQNSPTGAFIRKNDILNVILNWL